MTDHAELARVLFAPRAMALIGASNNPSKLITARPLEYLRRYGFAGRIYPVNPRYDEVQGLPCYPSLADIGAPVDLAIVALPRERVLDALRSCVDAGVRAAIVFSSGFGEVAGEGPWLQDAVTELAGNTGLAVVGPNCQGLANLTNGTFPCFSTVFATEAPRIGPTAVISQSGAVAGMILNQLHAAGVGARYWASTGNEADVTVARVARGVLEDAQVQTVLCYLESVRDRPVWTEVATRAAELGKRVLFVRPAGTATGWAAAGRHTGAGVNDPLGHAGSMPAGTHLIGFDSLEEMVGYASLARTGKTPRGDRVALLSNSGGLGVLMADAAQAGGLSMAELSERTGAELGKYLPGFASTVNPVDVTAQLLNDNTLLSKALPALSDDDDVDIVLVGLGAVGEGYGPEQIIEDLAAAGAATDRLYVVVWVGSRMRVRERLGELGVPTFDDIASAVTALTRYVRPCAGTGTAEPFSPYFDELAEGQTIHTPSLVVPESDVDTYATLARQHGKVGNLHVDLAAALRRGYPNRVVAGLHLLSYLAVLADEIELLRNATVLAGLRDVRFLQPVFPGDAVRVEFTVAGRKPLRGGERSGIVALAFELFADDGEQQRLAARGEISYVFNTGQAVHHAPGA